MSLGTASSGCRVRYSTAFHADGELLLLNADTASATLAKVSAAGVDATQAKRQTTAIPAVRRFFICRVFLVRNAAGQWRSAPGV